MDPVCLSLLRAALLCHLIGTAAGVLLKSRNAAANGLSFGSAIAASCLTGTAAVLGLIWNRVAGGQAIELWPSLLPFVRFTVNLDALGAFFLLILSLLGVALSIYSIGYARGFYGRKSVGVLGAFYNLLLLSTTLVFLAANAFFFLIAWEIMALTAYCLVSFEHEQTEARKAGVLYFIMSHLGTGCLILGFLLLFQVSGDYTFGGFHHLGEKMGEGHRNAAFLLFLVGFGVKAGIVPLHIWLPAAHPVAPSNISALLSGVLIKTGIYGLTRVFFDFLGAPPMWWGVTILTIGTVSAILGSFMR